MFRSEFAWLHNHKYTNIHLIVKGNLPVPSGIVYHRVDGNVSLTMCGPSEDFLRSAILNAGTSSTLAADFRTPPEGVDRGLKEGQFRGLGQGRGELPGEASSGDENLPAALPWGLQGVILR